MTGILRSAPDRLNTPYVKVRYAWLHRWLDAVDGADPPAMVVVTGFGFRMISPWRIVWALGSGRRAQCERMRFAGPCGTPILCSPVRRFRRASSHAEGSLITRYGIGVDNVDLIAARKQQIPVYNVPTIVSTRSPTIPRLILS